MSKGHGKRKKPPQIVATHESARPPAILAFVERHKHAIVFALILIGSIRIISTYRIFNHTYDEPAHIACGMEWLDKKVYRWEPQHPPLARVAAAIGPFLLGIRSQGVPNKGGNSMFEEGEAILYRGHHYDLTLMLARLAILPFFWVACLAVYQWGSSHFSPAVGVAAVFSFSFLPPILAHAGLATTDMALTAFMGATFLCAWTWFERPTLANAAFFGASAALLVLSKFSSLAFFPSAVAATIVLYLVVERPKLSWLMEAAKGRLLSLALSISICCVLIWAGYRFSIGSVSFSKVHLPAPELYAGIQQVLQHNVRGHPSYLLGERSWAGFRSFYTVALGVKTPLAFLLLLGYGIVVVLRESASVRRFAPLAFSAGILAVGFFSRINIGIRHILPVYLGFSILAAVAIVQLVQLAATKTSARIGLPLLLAWIIVVSVWNHPDYLPYFNELAGSEPEKILVDSDLDWGQDLKRLATRLHEVSASEVSFVNIFPADLERQHGFPPLRARLDVVNPSPGWNAVSVTAWKAYRLGLFETHPEAKLWPDRIKPMERVGKSILLWYFPPSAGN